MDRLTTQCDTDGGSSTSHTGRLLSCVAMTAAVLLLIAGSRAAGLYGSVKIAYGPKTHPQRAPRQIGRFHI